MKFFVPLITIVAVIASAGCQQQQPPPTVLQGDWVLDVDAMSKQLAAAGVGAAELDIYRRKNGNGLTSLSISGKSMLITLVGNKIEVPYEVTATHADCFEIRHEKKGETHQYCVAGKKLEIRDPQNPIVETFIRR